MLHPHSRAALTLHGITLPPPLTVQYTTYFNAHPVGGLPDEDPEPKFSLCMSRGFSLARGTTCGAAPPAGNTTGAGTRKQGLLGASPRDCMKACDKMSSCGGFVYLNATSGTVGQTRSELSPPPLACRCR